MTIEPIDGIGAAPSGNQEGQLLSPADTASLLVDWRFRYYYYQNPTTGTVSQNPLAADQLVKLLVPVREGRSAIFPAHTQCLMVPVETAESATSSTSKDDSVAPSFGTWQSVSSVHGLREAACAQWFWTGTAEKDESETKKTTNGPGTCRSLLEAYRCAIDPTKVLVFAQDITPEWTAIDELDTLTWVLDSLQPSQPPPPCPPTDSAPDTAAPTSNSGNDGTAASQEVQDELEAFLSSTAAMGNANGDNEGAKREKDGDNDDDDQEYESDGGTRYVKDPISGRWIHEALAPPRDEKANGRNSNRSNQSASKPYSTAPSGKKSKKAKFSKRNARHWVYVSGLPTSASSHEVTTEALQKYFGKAGLLDLDPETMQPKVKLYRHSDGCLKGDASLCYARPESVDLALQILDESPWDEQHTIRVEKAKFEANAQKEGGKRRKNVSEAQRKVARLALRQAQDEGFGERLAGGRKGLRIVVVKHMLDGIPEDEWETAIQKRCHDLEAEVEKITCISKTKVVLVKFVEPTGASQAVDAWQGAVNDQREGLKMEALYWDGVTDYTHSADDHNPEEEEKRHDDFGKWLDEQGEEELPPELRLQVAEE